MKTYELYESPSGIQNIKRTDSDGKVWFIPPDPANPHYAEYLRYTTWVEEGNDPEDFWTQGALNG